MMSDDRANLIELAHVSKRYSGSKQLAVNDLSLEVKAGEVYGFLGPNGAGKTTTIRMLMGFISPSMGSLKVMGQPMSSGKVQAFRSIGYLSSDFAVYPKMTGKQFLSYMGGLLPAKSVSYTRKLAARMNVEDDMPLGELSRGNRQKFGIIQAFMHQPDVLILDEPTSGLDPLMQEVFYDLIKESKERQAAIFMSSHILSEVQKACDRVGIIRQGELINELSMADLAREAAQTFDVEFASKIPLAPFKKLKNVQLDVMSENKISLHVHGSLSPLLALLSRYDVHKLEVHSADLEDAFFNLYRSEPGENR